MDQIAGGRQLAAEVAEQVTLLLETTLTDLQRERLRYIHKAVGALLTLLGGAETTVAPTLEPIAPGERPVEPSLHVAQARPLVLLVEDNPFTQKLMTRLLLQQGYRVEVAQNGQDAVDQLARLPVDLVLMDLRMPVMDGFQATREIRSREATSGAKRLPILAVTALLGEEDQRHAMEVGMDGYHAKPVRAAVLFSEMERLLSIPAEGDTAPPAALEADGERVIVDMDRLLKTVDFDLDLLREISSLYFSDAPRQMARIERGLADGDANEVREAAHSLKGATGAFGRVEVHTLAFQIEQAGKSGELRRAAELWPRLGSALRLMEETIQKEISQLSGESS
ncbi:Sensor histidine kinase RcsC [Candidatus Magnetaquicoccaceae bacterium FCR-1]|uniref:Sensor histidine kinase RcsC n=1 Tax=Candidatus Magnetaquiglobus chichijimensis TaxID=3141448 RepID=A0ABQ0C9U4_9PROT